MSAPGTTPGPWFAHPIHVRDNWKASKPIFDDGLWHVRMEYDPETCPIAEIDRGDDHDEATRGKAKFDAYLIAAAPDLYDAAQEAADLCVGTFAEGGSAHKRILAALAKARGEA